jgi:hypothetical protein
MPEAAHEWFYGQRLSPPPDSRQNVLRTDAPVPQHIRLGWMRECRKWVKQVLEAPGMFLFPCALDRIGLNFNLPVQSHYTKLQYRRTLLQDRYTRISQVGIY